MRPSLSVSNFANTAVRNATYVLVGPEPENNGCQLAFAAGLVVVRGDVVLADDAACCF